MGDLADYYIDVALDEQYEFVERIGEWMKLSPAELAKETAQARLPMVMDIRKLVLAGQPITPRQKRVLATWLAIQA